MRLYVFHIRFSVAKYTAAIIFPKRYCLLMADEKKETEEPEETHFDRRRKYKELVSGGMSDKEAMEKTWPTSAASIAKNVKEKADNEEKKKKEK